VVDHVAEMVFGLVVVEVLVGEIVFGEFEDEGK
jgi:hypothetical protein